MPKLTKCKTCNGQISSDASNCPHCGAKQPKSSGCCRFILLIIIFFVVAYALLPKGGDDLSSSTATTTTTAAANTPKMVFDEITAISFARTKLQEVLKVKTKIRFPKPGKVNPLKGTHQKTMGFKGSLHEIKQGFEVLNENAVWIKFDYRAVVEFAPEKGYRVVLLQVDGQKIFPPLQ